MHKPSKLSMTRALALSGCLFLLSPAVAQTVFVPGRFDPIKDAEVLDTLPPILQDQVRPANASNIERLLPVSSNPSDAERSVGRTLAALKMAAERSQNAQMRHRLCSAVNEIENALRRGRLFVFEPEVAGQGYGGFTSPDCVELNQAKRFQRVYWDPNSRVRSDPPDIGPPPPPPSMPDQLTYLSKDWLPDPAPGQEGACPRCNNCRS